MMSEKQAAVESRRSSAVILALAAVASVIAVVSWLVVFKLGSEQLPSDYHRLQLTIPSGEFNVWLTSYPEGADAAIDGVESGKTPIPVVSMTPGQHFVKLRMPGYLPIDTSVTMVEPKRIVLDPFVFRRVLSFRSTPDAAAVIVNGDTLPCVTPCSAEFPVSDTLNVSLTHDALDGIWMSFEDVVSGKWRTSHGQVWSVDLDTGKARLDISGCFLKSVRIITAPTGVAILFAADDSVAGESGQLLQLPMGSRDYVLRKSGFDDLPLSLNLNMASSAEHSYELTRTISITAFDVEGDAAVDIGARVIKMDRGSKEFYADARTPTSLRIPAAEYRVYVQADGFVDTSVVISADQVRLAVGMRPAAGKRDEKGMGDEKETGQVQRVSVRFIVSDKQTHERLSGVEIIADIKDQDRKVILGSTDRNGEYEQLLPLGKYLFTFSKDGYKSDDKGAKLKPDEPKTLEVRLKRR